MSVPFFGHSFFKALIFIFNIYAIAEIIVPLADNKLWLPRCGV